MYIKLKILDYILISFPSSYFGLFDVCSVGQNHTFLYFGIVIGPLPPTMSRHATSL